ncbi:MAG TPA: LLM class flavin-dependent oxidoreductase [Acidimicrobiales bacterium]|jgi:alkanesulfonate monooxygenase SsuD/methylene tetrahydromethanopterin reductase-like flavin-dependent oxidoreductase (luciferase family)|nr:LLM class flavin-dependent oxidoreductase [Acidimicrobiales bacterium]
MEFAIFYEIPQPRPWTPDSPHRALMGAVDAGVLADRMGFHSFWLTEHHFLPELSISTAPEVIFGHLAAKTERIRLGHGVKLLPFQYNHPIRVAEAAATLDHLCGGRFEFGTGRSATRNELEGFSVNPHETRGMQDEALEFIVRAWTEEEVEHEGKYFSMPKRNVVPKPFQSPHPPLWQATSSPDGHRATGEKGLGLLSFTVGVEPEMLVERITSYREGIAEAKPIGKFINDHVGVFTMVHCAPTMEESRDVASEAFEWYCATSGSYIANFNAWLQELSSDLGTYSYVKTQADAGAKQVGTNMTYDDLLGKGAVLAGDPSRCIEVAKRYEAAGCELLMCLVNPYNIPHEKMMQSIELLGEKVLPEFR